MKYNQITVAPESKFTIGIDMSLQNLYRGF